MKALFQQKEGVGQILSRLRAAGKLRKSNRPFLVADAVNALSSLPTGLNSADFPRAIVQGYGADCEILVRQILMVRYPQITAEIMDAIGRCGRAAVPFPGTWTSALSECGIPCSRSRSRRRLLRAAFTGLMSGVRVFARLALQADLESPKGPYVEFAGLSPANIPPRGSADSATILDWFRVRQVAGDLEADVWAQVNSLPRGGRGRNVRIVHSLLPRMASCPGYLRFLSRALRCIASAAVGTLAGRWWYGLLAEEGVSACYVDSLPARRLPGECLFHNSSWYYRPLWVEAAERRGTRTSLYYYSTNGEEFSFGEGHRIPRPYGLTSMSWNRFVVWDSDQAEFLKEALRPNQRAEFEIVGPIDFTDSSAGILLAGGGPRIAVFDVTPTRAAFYTSYGWSIPPYYSEEVSLAFAADVFRAAASCGAKVLWKRKRKVDQRFVSRAYMVRMRRLVESNPHVTMVDPGIAARRLIEKCDICISMPFTSTAIVAKVLGKATAYYDPTSAVRCQRDHGVRLLGGPDDLTRWLTRLAPALKQ